MSRSSSLSSLYLVMLQYKKKVLKRAIYEIYCINFFFFLCVKDEAEWVIIFSLQCFLKSSLSHIYMLTSELLIVCLPVQYPSHSVCLCSPLSIILPLYWAHKYTTQWFIFLIFHMLWLSPMSALQSVAGKLSLLTPPASYCSFMSLMLTASQ